MPREIVHIFVDFMLYAHTIHARSRCTSPGRHHVGFGGLRIRNKRNKHFHGG